MRDESQNALLKTLEEPPDFVHLILLSSEPEALLETVASRCQPVDFAPLPGSRCSEADARRMAAAGAPVSARGDRRRRAARCRRLWSGPGCSAQRARSRAAAPRPSAASPPPSPASSASAPLASAARRAPRPPARTPKQPRASARGGGRGRRQAHRHATSPTRPNAPAAAAAPRSSTSASSSAPPGCATSPPSPPAPRRSCSTATASRSCARSAAGLDPARARRAAELVQDTRRRLDLNVSEELALEALSFRLERLLT